MKWKRIGVATLLAGTAATALTVNLFGGHHARTRPCLPGGIPAADYQFRQRSVSDTVISRTALLLEKSTMETDELLGDPARINSRTEYSNENVETFGLVKDMAQYRLDQRHTEVFRQTDRNQQRTRRLEDRNIEVLPAPSPTLPSSPLDTAPLTIDRRQTHRDVVTARLPDYLVGQKRIIKLYQLDRQRLQSDHCSISQVALQLHNDGQWVLSLRGDQNPKPEDGKPAPFNPTLHIKRNEFVVRLRCLGASQNEPAANGIGAGKPVLVDLAPCSFWVQNGQPRWVRTGGCSETVRTYLSRIDRVEIEFFYH